MTTQKPTHASDTRRVRSRRPTRTRVMRSESNTQTQTETTSQKSENRSHVRSTHRRSPAKTQDARHSTSKPTRRERPTQRRNSSSGATRNGQFSRRGPEKRGRAPRKTTASAPAKKLSLPPAGDAVRVIPLGGVEEIGRNMTAIEYKDDIIVIDAGFQFKEDNTPGVDYILPNTQYLEENKDKIRGMLVSHGHLDHIGGIPFIMDRIGNPKIYTRNLTSIMIKKRQTEFPHLPPLEIEVIEGNETVMLGNIKVRFFAVTHTIPDSMGIIIETPYGSVVTPGDFKLTHTDGVPHEDEEKSYKVFDKEKVLLMLSDSTNVDNPGYSTPEHDVHKNLDEIIRSVKGRLIIGTFASQLERLIKIIESAEKYKKKIVVEGRSMKTNIEIAQLAGLLKPNKDTIIPAQDIDNYPPSKILVLSTGAQGEEFAALMRIANKTHKYIRLAKTDTVLLSSSVVPGNEKTVQKLKDNIARNEARIITYRTSEVYIHSSGHGNQEEVKWLHKKVNPKFFIPIHGSHYMLRQHAHLAESLGMPSENIVVPDNGMVIDVTDKGMKVQKEKAGEGMVLVDGFAIGNIQEVVLRDRQMLAQDGMFVIIATVNSKTGKLRKSPDIISRGFVYLRESQELLHQARIITKKTIESTTIGMNPINFDMVKTKVTDEVAKFLFQNTAKRPIVIPVLLGI